MDRGAWQAIVYEVENESDVTEWLNNNNISTWYIPGTEKALSNTQTHTHTHIPFVITCSNRNHPQGGGMTVKAFRREPQDSLKVQWLRLCISNAEDTGLIPGQGTKIPHAMWPKKRGEKEEMLSLCFESCLHGFAPGLPGKIYFPWKKCSMVCSSQDTPALQLDVGMF